MWISFQNFNTIVVSDSEFWETVKFFYLAEIRHNRKVIGSLARKFLIFEMTVVCQMSSLNLIFVFYIWMNMYTYLLYCLTHFQPFLGANLHNFKEQTVYFQLPSLRFSQVSLVWNLERKGVALLRMIAVITFCAHIDLKMSENRLSNTCQSYHVWLLLTVRAGDNFFFCDLRIQLSELF